MSDIALKQPGVEHAVAFPGLSINGFTNSSNCGHRVRDAQAVRRAQDAPTLSGGAIAEQLNQKFAAHPGRLHRDLPAAAGAGPRHHRRLQAADRGPRRARLRGARRGARRRSWPRPRRRRSSPACSPATRSTCRSSTPTSTAPRRASSASPVTDVFDTMQIYLGSLYVNDFNQFGRTYPVRVQADAAFRARAEDIGAAEGALDRRRDGAAGGAAEGEAELRPRARHALQRLPRRRHQRRRRRPAIRRARRRTAIERIAAETLPHGIELRVDRADLPGDPRRQLGAAGVPARDPAGVPGAGRAVREPVAAAGDHPDRADGPARGDDRRLAHRRRQQHLHADRPDRAGRAGVRRTRS